MKFRIIALSLVLLSTTAFSQKYYTKSGKISFNASSALEKIEAINEKSTVVVDASTGALEVAVLMKAFSFEKALMQEHFNENYVESDKYPKASFKGSFTNFSTVNREKDGVYPVKIKGEMTLHGVTKEITADGTLTVKGGAIVSGKSDFKIRLSDYNIEIPSLVKDKISNDVNIKVDSEYQQLKS